MRGETWRKANLGELASFIGGCGFPDKFQGGKEAEIPFYKVSDMSFPGNEIALLVANNYVSRTLASRQGWKIAPPGGIAFAKVGAALLLNRRRFIQRDSLVDNNMMVAIPGDHLNSTWLYWWLQTIDFGRFVQPGVVPSVNQAQLRSIEVFLPPLLEQRRIAEILDTVDEAIRRTEQVIAKLQQMKQGLLHDLLTRGIDENGELRPPPEEAPHLYKDSPLGLIPRNWDYSELRRTGTWLSGGTPPKNEPRFWGGSIPWVSPKDMKCFLMEDTEDHVTTSGASVGSQRVSPGAVLIVVRGMILAHTFPVCITLREMTFNQDIKALVPRQEISGLFLAYWMVCNKDSLLGIVTEATHGTKRIDMDDLGDLLIALPPKNEVQNILNRLQALDRDLLANNNYLLKLRSVKSGLMHDLLTGRIRVPTDSVCVEVNPTEVA